MKQPEISVVVPVHNTSKYLEQCLMSIVNQTFKDLEIICIDDGSTDCSLNILRKMEKQDTRIFVVHRDRASGSAAVPRNIGLSYAKGKYVIFLDSDDYFDNRMLEKMFCCAEEKNADLIMCDNYVISSMDNLVKNYEGELHHKYMKQKDVFSYQDIPDTIFQISNAAVWHKLILRDTLVCHQLKFQERVPVLDDIYFVNLLLVLSKRIYILDEKLVFYRESRPDGQTTTITEHKESIYLAFKELNDYLIKNKMYDKVKRSLQNWTILTLQWWYYAVKKKEIAMELFDLYKNFYFQNLGLMDIDVSDIYEDNKVFYHYVLYEDFRPSIGAILNSISMDGIHLVLYGAGKLGKDIYEYIIRNEPQYTVSLWCDINADKMGNLLIKMPEKIKETEYDAILIAIGQESIVLEAKRYLISLGVDEKKIYTI